MTIAHVVLFGWKADATKEQVTKVLLAAFLGVFRELNTYVSRRAKPCLHSGKNVSIPRARNHTFELQWAVRILARKGLKYAISFTPAHSEDCLREAHVIELG